MTYRSRYFTTLQPLAVLDLLMADETNPRSLNFQVAHIADLYRKLPRHAADDLAAIRHALKLLRGLDLERLDFPLSGAGRPEGSDGRARLDQSLDIVQNLLPSWADNISLTYFNHARSYPISIGG